jgi:energy-coupling factor transporter ATP-binding protein EcfA2
MPAPGTLGTVNVPVIELTGLRKGFGRITAVDGIDLSIGRGEVVALLGPNGAGKSTTIDLALGLAAPTDDLRAAVAGYREMSLDTELAAARAALAAASIDATIPVSGNAVEPRLRELFAWAVRESVTNVIRHAQASQCEISLSADSVSVADDGVGLPAPAQVKGAGETDAGNGIRSGHGLAGLSERAAAADAAVIVEPAPGRGTVVTVRAVAR